MNVLADIKPEQSLDETVVQGMPSFISCTSRHLRDSNNDGIGDFAGLTSKLD